MNTPTPSVLSKWNQSLSRFFASRSGDMMDHDTRLDRARFRAWHRGTREADYMIGCFFDRYHKQWTSEELEWFEALLDEDDVDIMAWAFQAQPVPEKYSGRMMQTMQKLDYVKI